MSSATLEAVLALDVLCDGRPWAIMPEHLRAAREHDIQALAARIGKPLAGPGRDVANHNGTAVLDIQGPLFRYRSIWTWLLGGTAVEDTAIGLHAALDDPAVNSIVLAINSPGGQIDGINELANMIRAANTQKPVTAYVEGLAGSGAYWLASAAGRIVADETAQLGSIGVLATVIDDSDADAKRGVKRYDVVSSQSPLKRTDPATDEGRKQLQQMVDAMAQVFIEKVAGFRGTSVERVGRDFGQGAVLPARSAIAVGMADALGSLEALIAGGDGSGDPMRQMRDVPGMRVVRAAGMVPPAEGLVEPAAQMDEEELEEETQSTQLNDDPTHCPGTCGNANGEDEDEDEEEEENESEGTEQEPDDSSIPKGVTVAQQQQPAAAAQQQPPAAQQPPPAAAAAQQPPAAAAAQPTNERQRIAAILNCEEARGREDLARTLALETDLSVEAAVKLLKSTPVAARPANPLEARMSQIRNPNVGVQPAEGAEDDSPAAEVNRVLAFVPKNRLRAHVQKGN